MSQDYDPFNGYSARTKQTTLTRNVTPIDYSKTAPPSKWVLFSSKSPKETNQAKIQVKTSLMTADASEKWREEHQITAFGECPPPFATFDNLAHLVPSSVLSSFSRQKFTAPTAIQAQAWPILFANRDIVGIAKTGSGKTLGFMVPAISHIENQPPLERGDGPLVLVMAPTRELAQQIDVETKKVLPQGIRSACIFGGAPKGPQLAELQAGAHILIATPGRLLDFVQIRKTNLNRVTFLVLDEADRMLDMGFEPQVRAVCSQIRPDRQTLMFSATWPKEIQALAATFQRDFVRIHVGSTELTANTDVTQHFVFTSEYEKFGELRKLLARYLNKRVLVFAKMKRTTDQLERQLRGIGVNAMALHGDKEQSQRDYILNKFKKEALVLIATDVAARGLDVKELEVVINYDFPMQIDDYIHRIGRTGRAGAKGEAFTLLTQQEEQVTPYVASQLVSILEKAHQSVPSQLKEWASKSNGPKPTPKPGFGRSSRNMPSFSYQGGNRTSGVSVAASSPTVFGVPTNAPRTSSFRCVFESDEDEPGNLPASTKKHRTEA